MGFDQQNKDFLQVDEFPQVVKRTKTIPLGWADSDAPMWTEKFLVYADFYDNNKADVSIFKQSNETKLIESCVLSYSFVQTTVTDKTWNCLRFTKVPKSEYLGNTY